VGIGRPPGNGVDYVLSPFTAAEQAQIPDTVSRVADAVLVTVDQGIERAMTEFNRV
jgi:PTH1 family peptidyl-tRNA hydrolase